MAVFKFMDSRKYQNPAAEARGLLVLSKRESEKAKQLREAAKDASLEAGERDRILKEAREKLRLAQDYANEAKRLVGE